MSDRTIEGAIDDAMGEDPLGDAEKTVGKILDRPASYKEGGEIGELVTAIGFKNMQVLREKKQTLAALSNDTVLCNKLDRYLSIIADLGFKKVLEMDVPERRGDRGDKLFIFVTEDGLVLKFDTYNGTSVNSSNLYYNYASNDPSDRRPSVYGGGGTTKAYNPETGVIRDDFKYVSKYSATEDNPEVDEWKDYLHSDQWTVQAGNYDGREFLRRTVNCLRKGTLLSQWAYKPFLWFLHYEDSNCPACFEGDSRCGCTTQFTYDHNAINKARIEAADPSLAKILN